MTSSVSFLGLTDEFGEFTISVDAGAGVLCQLPGLFIPHVRRVKGPGCAYSGFDRVYPAAAVLKEDTEAVRPGSDCEAAVSRFAVLSHKGLRGDPQEFGDSLRFPVA